MCLAVEGLEVRGRHPNKQIFFFADKRVTKYPLLCVSFLPIHVVLAYLACHKFSGVRLTLLFFAYRQRPCVELLLLLLLHLLCITDKTQKPANQQSINHEAASAAPPCCHYRWPYSGTGMLVMLFTLDKVLLRLPGFHAVRHLPITARLKTSSFSLPSPCLVTICLPTIHCISL